MKDIFAEELRIINIGLDSFTGVLAEKNVPYVQVGWKPPLSVSEAAQRAIMAGTARRQKANALAMEKIFMAKPMLLGLNKALTAIPGMKKNMILHAGPPVSWKDMCGPMQGGIIGALLYEGWAKTPAAARKIAASGKIEYSPCHEHQAVGPMAGIVSPSMPVFPGEERGVRQHGLLHHERRPGQGAAIRRFRPEVIQKLRWMEKILYPNLEEALRLTRPARSEEDHRPGPAHGRRGAQPQPRRHLAPLPGHRAGRHPHVPTSGDRRRDPGVHQRQRPFLPESVDGGLQGDPGRGARHQEQQRGRGHGPQRHRLRHAACRDRRRMVHAARRRCRTRCSSPATPRPTPIPTSATAITETNGLGGFAIAASPAIVQFVGGSSADAIRYTRQMYEITAAENNVYQIPCLDFRGTPTGIDVVKVIEKDILPFIDTGVAHKKAGHRPGRRRRAQRPGRAVSESVSRLSPRPLQQARR